MRSLGIILSHTYWRSLLFMLIAFVYSCNQPATKEERLYVELECKHIDSIWQFYQNGDGVGEHGAELVNKVNALLVEPTLLDSGLKLIRLMDGYSQAKPEPHFLAYYYAMQSRIAWYQGEDSLGDSWHGKWLNFASFATDMNVISHYLDLGNLCFNQSNFDSAIVHYRKALMRSRSSDDDFFRITILNNLGAAYFYTHMMSLASDCFADVLVQIEEKMQADPAFNMSNQDLTIIRANLIATLNQESNFTRATEVFSKFQDDAYKEDVQPYAQQLFTLNHVNTLMKLGRFDRAKSYLNRLQIDSVSPSLRSFFIGLQGSVYVEEEDYARLGSLLSQNLDWLTEKMESDLSDFNDVLIAALKKGLVKLDYPKILILYNEVKDQDDAFVNTHFTRLLAAISEQEGRKVESLKWELASRDFALEFQNSVDEFKISDINNQVQLSKLKSEVSSKEKLIAAAHSKQQFLVILVSISVAFLLALGFLVFTWNKSKKQKLELLTLESEKQAQSIELLRMQNEKQMNSILSSNYAVKQLQHIIHKMRDPHLVGNPVMMGFRQDLEQLLAVEFNAALGSQSEAAETVDDFEYLKTQFPQLSEWNDTAFKILVLSVLDNQPKEIAKLLSLNMQYVRNVRSKLKKIIADQMPADWNWPDLKKFKNA